MGKTPRGSSSQEKGEKKRGRDDKKNQVYREFSRERYNKYKRQFPRMRESEIVSKIIKEWEAMGEEKKQSYEKKYIERSGAQFFKSGSSSLSKNKSSSKSKSKSKEEGKGKGKGKGKKKKTALIYKPISGQRSGQRSGSYKRSSSAISPAAHRHGRGKQVKKKKESPKTRVYQEKKKSPKRQTSDFKRSTGSKGSKSKHFDSFDDPSDEIGKRKGGKKGKIIGNSEYVQFFKYYYERLNNEHPRWNSNQITTIIKLLWKKRAKQRGRGDSKRRPGKKIEKTVSGWLYYRKTKEAEGMTRQVIKSMWKALPIESKRYYKLQGQGKNLRPKRTSGMFVRKVLNAGIARTEEVKGDGLTQKDYSWMDNQMI